MELTAATPVITAPVITMRTYGDFGASRRFSHALPLCLRAVTHRADLAAQRRFRTAKRRPTEVAKRRAGGAKAGLVHHTTAAARCGRRDQVRIGQGRHARALLSYPARSDKLGGAGERRSEERRVGK